MAAYVIVDVEVKDPVRYEEYKAMAAPTVALYGGKYIVRGGTTEILEGAYKPNRIVVLEFETMEQARQWWHSPEYSNAKQLRQSIATTTMFIVEGK
ncbi:MAG: DUF1330 domain-containing protein [Ignavibacteriales bacterium]|nr:DUF1330 domain-containing protein [Ignavibacteriales bacterium]MBI3787061.1 DUF1330 domain-containing protein [Ignavibacteriales bacterium]